jgi:hypothetical protein
MTMGNIENRGVAPYETTVRVTSPLAPTKPTTAALFKIVDALSPFSPRSTVVANLRMTYRRCVFALRWPMLVHWIFTFLFVYLFPLPCILYLVPSVTIASYWWWRSGHNLMNTPEALSPFQGSRAPPLVTIDGKNKELWGLSATPVSARSWVFYYLFLRTEQMYDKCLSMVFYMYQRANSQARATASDSFKRAATGELILQTSLVMSFKRSIDIDGKTFLLFEFGDVYFPLPSGEMAEYPRMTSLVDVATVSARTYVNCDPLEAGSEANELNPTEAGFMLQYFLGHGAHPPVHAYASWASRIPPEEQDECTFWMQECSNAMVVESRALVPTFTMYEDLFWSLPEQNYHVRGLNANLRFPTEHRQLANAKLFEASTYCRFIVAMRGATFRAFAKHGVKYDPEILMAAMTHSVDHRGMWVHRIPSCYEWHGVNLLKFWELQTRAPLALFVDTKMSSAPLPYLQDIYESMAEVDRCLADAMHWAVAW